MFSYLLSIKGVSNRHFSRHLPTSYLICLELNCDAKGKDNSSNCCTLNNLERLLTEMFIIIGRTDCSELINLNVSSLCSMLSGWYSRCKEMVFCKSCHLWLLSGKTNFF